jgi:cysteine-rich repeat protein
MSAGRNHSTPGPWLAAIALAALAFGPVCAVGIDLDLEPGPGAGEVTLLWTGAAPSFGIYRSAGPAAVADASNLLEVTTLTQWTDAPPPARILYYLVEPPICGNGVRESGEQCDDANLVDLDGCDAACGFEQAQRAIWFKMQFATDSYCPANAFGLAFTSSIQSYIQGGIDSGVASGERSVILTALGATDLTGANDASFQLGFLTGRPETRGGTLAYDGTGDLDWWHVIDAGVLAPGRSPLHQLPATIANHVMTAGPGTALIPVLVTGGPPTRLAAARLSVTTGNATAPRLSTNGDPPGHLPGEHLDPALSSYKTCGVATASGSGRLCGNITARTLSQTPIAPALVGTTGCSQGFTLSNSMLDAMVVGCTALGVQQIRPTQPDTSDPSAPVAGAGPKYKLTVNSQKVVVGCKDRNGASVDLGVCLDSAAYSSYFRLATNRIIPK